MAELRSTSMQGASGAIGAGAPKVAPMRPATRRRAPDAVEERRTPVFDAQESQSIERAVAAFIEPPAKAAGWLHDPALSMVLRQASDALAPDGVAQDAADRYAASVIETHLAARKRLAKHVNALIKT